MKAKLTPEEYETLRWLKAQNALYDERGGRRSSKFTSMFAFYVGWTSHAPFNDFGTFLKKADASRKAAFKNFLNAYAVHILLRSDRS